MVRQDASLAEEGAAKPRGDAADCSDSGNLDAVHSDAALCSTPRERLRSAPQSVEDQNETASAAAQNRHERVRGDTVADGTAAPAGGLLKTWALWPRQCPYPRCGH